MDRISKLTMEELLLVQRMFEKPKVWFYGIEGIQIIDNGEWSDATLIYKDKEISWFNMEDSLYNDFLEVGGKDGDDKAFLEYVRGNKEYVFEVADYLYENNVS